MITVRVLLFGHYKDVFPGGETALELPHGATATDAANALAAQNHRFAKLLTQTRIAVRESFAAPETVLEQGDEIAFLPPMSGG